MSIKKVFSMDKAIQLSDMGNLIIDAEINHKNPNLKVFIFLNTEKINEDWKKLK